MFKQYKEGRVTFVSLLLILLPCTPQAENTGTKLISNTKKHKLKIWSRVWNCRYTMLYKRRRERNRGKKRKEKKSHRNYKKTIGTKLITYTKRLKLKI